MEKQLKELKDELRFQKYRADKLDDMLWELICSINREDKVSGISGELRSSQVEAERLMAHLREKQHEREVLAFEEASEKPVVD